MGPRIPFSYSKLLLQRHHPEVLQGSLNTLGTSLDMFLVDRVTSIRQKGCLEVYNICSLCSMLDVLPEELAAYHGSASQRGAKSGPEV